MEESRKCNWIEAYSDNYLSIHTLPQSLLLTDVNLDSEEEVVVVDYGECLKSANMGGEVKMKIIKGTTLISEIRLSEAPSGILSIHTDSVEGSVPVLIAASGNSLYMYKNSKPLHKCTIPQLATNQEEEASWSMFREGAITAEVLTMKLDSLRGMGKITELSDKTLQLLLLEESAEKGMFADNNKTTPLVKLDCITCITSLLKRPNDEVGVSYVVMATENKFVYLINPETFNYMLTMSLPSEGAQLVAVGCYDVSYKIFITCRDCCVYGIKRDSTTPKKLFSTPSPIISTAVVNRDVVVVCMDDNMMCFNTKGSLLWSVVVPGNIVTMTTMYLSMKNQWLLLVSVLPYQPIHQTFSSLSKDGAGIRSKDGGKDGFTDGVTDGSCEGGRILVYDSKDLLDVIPTRDAVTAMVFGRFCREDSVLIMFTQNGGLHVKILKRKNSITDGLGDDGGGVEGGRGGVAGGDGGRLDGKRGVARFELPKKNKVYLDQLSREKEQCVEIHERFQQDLLNMKLLASRTLITLIKQHHLSTISTVKQGPSVNMDVQVTGLGGTFRLEISLFNHSLNHPCTDLSLHLGCDSHLYTLESSHYNISMIPPSFTHKLHTLVHSNPNPKLTSGIINVHLYSPLSNCPSHTASVDIPFPQDTQ